MNELSKLERELVDDEDEEEEALDEMELEPVELGAVSLDEDEMWLFLFGFRLMDEALFRDDDDDDDDEALVATTMAARMNGALITVSTLDAKK